MKLNEMPSQPLVTKDKAASGLHAPPDWPIYILSLEGDEERRAPLLSALSDMGLSAEVLIGVDGRKGLPAWAEKKICRRRRNPANRPMTDGEYACALSHVAAYRKILDENLPGAIIFEDDARIDERFKTFVESRAFAMGDMILMGHSNCWVSFASKKVISSEIVLLKVAVKPVLAHAYSLSDVAAQKLVLAATPVREIADWPFDISKMRVWAVDPQLAYQSNEGIEQSHIETERAKEKSNDRTLRPWNQRKRVFLKRLTYEWWSVQFRKLLSHRLS